MVVCQNSQVVRPEGATLHRRMCQTQSVRAESPAPHSPGQRPGYFVFLKNNAPCKGNTLIIKLLPLQGVRLVCTF